MIECPDCHRANQQDSNFCENCRAPLGSKKGNGTTGQGAFIKCKSCGHEINPPDAKFCMICREPIGSKPPPPSTKASLSFPNGRELLLSDNQTCIGRSDFIDSKRLTEDELKQISRKHATVFIRNAAAFIIDGKSNVQDKVSTNGTYVLRKGHEIEITGKGSFKLDDNDEISLAKVASLKFRLKKPEEDVG